VIHLDTNVLIAGVQAGTAENTALRGWLAAGEKMAVSSLVWMEFVTGPLDQSSATAARFLIEGRIVPVGGIEAELAAELYNLIGRRRALRIDCLIAATAVNAGARLATRNTADFRLFVGRGLVLA
jgi:predicted nucleic acid-binding protein